MTENKQDIIAGEIITLVDEDDKEVSFEMVEVFEVNGKRYTVMQPVDKENCDEDLADGEALIFRVEIEPEGDIVFAIIEDDEEWEAAIDAYNEIVFADDEN